MATVPGYISRSVAGSYDNEGIAIFALMFTYYLWVRSLLSCVGLTVLYHHLLTRWNKLYAQQFFSCAYVLHSRAYSKQWCDSGKGSITAFSHV